jgi:hypothetical protein
MGDDQRFEKWASGVLGVVSLLLILNLVRVFAVRWRAVFPRRHDIAQSRPAADLARLSPAQFPKVDHAKKARQAARRTATFRRPPEAARSAGPAANPPAHIRAEAKQAPPSPQSATSHAVVNFQSIGYIERADGTRQAAVSEGDRVFLVHEGDTFDDHYRVLKITPSSVEVADLPATPVEASPDARGGSALAARHNSPSTPVRTGVASGEAGPPLNADPSPAVLPTPRVQSAWRSSTSEVPGQPLIAMTRGEANRNIGHAAPSATVNANGKVSGVGHFAPSADGPRMLVHRPDLVIQARKMTLVTTKSASSGAERLGFVELGGKPAETIVADGDQIRLIPEMSEVAETSRGGKFSESAGERAEALDGRSPVMQGTTLVSGESPPPSKPPLAALDALLAAPPPRENGAIAANLGSGWRSPPDEPPWNPSHGASDRGPPVFREVLTRAGPLNRFADRADSEAAKVRTFKAFCFVEKENGSREAFIALGDEVYLVHEGEVFAHRYRVLKISPTRVEAADERAEENKSPPVLDQEIAQNWTKISETLKSADHRAPETLPLDDTLRSLAVVSRDVGLPGTFGGPALRGLSAAMRAGPTLQDARSSTSSVPVLGLNNISFLAGPPFASPARVKVAGDPSGTRKSSGPDPARPGKGVVRHVTASEGRPAAVTPLPIKVSGTLLGLPEQVLQGTPSGGAPGAQPAKELSRFSGGSRDTLARLEGPSAGQGLLVPAAGGGVASLAGPPIPSGSDLHLDFSIGDNGCYFPR